MSSTSLWIAFGALAICTATGLVSVTFGPDNYQDLRFYHLYAPWAYLHGRYPVDVAPAESQTYFNPVADFLFYGMASSFLNGMPRFIAFVMGAVHGLNAVLVAAIAAHVIRPRDPPTRVALTVAATLIGVSGAGFVPLIGTTSNDLINSIFVLGGLLGILRVADQTNAQAAWRGFAWSGLLAGVGLGLKYTAAVFVPGFAVIAVVAAMRRKMPAAIVTFGACAALGFIVFAGHHLFTLWREFDNPIFPMLNNVFGSPYFDPISSADEQFRPRDVWQLIAYPFYWVKTTHYIISESPLRDWRGALAYVAIAAALVTCIVGWRRQREQDGGRETCGLGLVMVFVAVSYLAWAPVFGNIRYAVVLEMLTGVIVVGVVTWLARGRARRIGSAGALVAIVAATTIYPDWGRGQFGERYIDVRVPSLPANSLVLIVTRQPVAFFIPYAEPTARYLAIENDFLALSQSNRLVAEVESQMRTPDRAKFAVRVAGHDEDRFERVLDHFGLTLGPSPCRPIESNLENPALSLCPLVAR